jgi:hypothetical protein
MLVKLASGVDFTNIFMHSFNAQRSQKRKKSSVFSALLGSACAKAARKMLVKLISGCPGLKVESSLHQNTDL